MSRNMDWTVDAACSPNPAWTTESRPSKPVEESMRDICDSCPVIAKCAAWALKTKAHSGFYAGVWIPSRGNPAGRDVARRILTIAAGSAA